jgi:hypothetical protein
MEDHDLAPYLHELHMEARKLADAASQAAQLYADGDAQGACDMANLMHYNVDSVTELRVRLVDSFESHGFAPGRESG